MLAALIATALAQDHQVVVVHSADPALVEHVRGRLMRPGLLHDTDPWDLRADGIPTLADLDRYDAVLAWVDDPIADPESLGDALADYVDAHGGGLVLAGPSCAWDRGPTGRLESDGLLPFTQGFLGSSGGERALVNGPDHDLHGALGVIDAGISPRCTPLLTEGPVPLVWDDGTPLVSLHPQLRVAGVNLWPVDDDADPAGWLHAGHAEQVLVRALLWSSGWNWPSRGCRRATAELDRNCNGVLRSREPLVDPTDAACLMTSFDDYVEPFDLGCLVPVTADYDADGDGFVSGTVVQRVEDLEWSEWTLACDNCAADYDPLRFDLDCDGWGDLCDRCPFGDASDPLEDSDDDLDRIPDSCDNCRNLYNPTQDEDDGDGIGDLCDLCPDLADPGQEDRDDDEIGDACDPCPDLHGDSEDADQDGFGDACDRCPVVGDPDQIDLDRDGWGDACDTCPLDADGQIDTDGDGWGDACDTCPELRGPPDEDRDGDGVGDACDPCPDKADERRGDIDEDGVPDVCDLCLDVPDPHQRDVDHDGIGNLCDVCPEHADPAQADGDGDGKGDVCDTVWIRGGGAVCGCDAGGGGPSVGLLLLVAALRRRKRG